MTFGERLRALRSADGLSLAQLGERVGYTRAYLWDLETGRRAPSLALARRLDTALGSGGVLAALLAVPEAAPVIPLGPDDVPAIHGTITHIAGLDTLHGADGLIDTGLTLYRGYRARAAGVVDQAVRAAVAELGQLAAWLAHDADRDDLCRALLLEALADAEAVGASVRWLCLEQLSMLADWTGRPADSLLYAERGLAESPPPATEGMLRMRRARALAELAPGVEARREAERAYGLLAAGPTVADPPWAWWLHEPEARLHLGAVWTALGEHDRAVTSVYAAVVGLPVGQRRDVAVYRARLAVAQGAAGDWAGVVETASGTTPGSARARVELRRAGVGAPVEVRAALAG